MLYGRQVSIFKSDFLAVLKKWHDQYNAKFTLYCYSFADQFRVSQIPSSCCREFGAHADWLKLGFHSSCYAPFLEEREYDAGFDLVERTVRRLRAGKTNTLRLHYWKANPEQKDFLRKKTLQLYLAKIMIAFPITMKIFSSAKRLFTEGQEYDLKTLTRSRLLLWE
jgi:hypothetical protein